MFRAWQSASDTNMRLWNNQDMHPRERYEYVKRQHCRLHRPCRTATGRQRFCRKIPVAHVDSPCRFAFSTTRTSPHDVPVHSAHRTASVPCAPATPGYETTIGDFVDDLFGLVVFRAITVSVASSRSFSGWRQYPWHTVCHVGTVWRSFLRRLQRLGLKRSRMSLICGRSRRDFSAPGRRHPIAVLKLLEKTRATSSVTGRSPNCSIFSSNNIVVAIKADFADVSVHDPIPRPCATNDCAGCDYAAKS